jgi:hypothetical protein
MKPREWYVVSGCAWRPDETRPENGIHVIEYSAYKSETEHLQTVINTIAQERAKLERAMDEELAKSAKLVEAVRAWEKAKYDGVVEAEKNLLAALEVYESSTTYF